MSDELANRPRNTILRRIAAAAGVLVLLAGFVLGASDTWWFVSIGVLGLGAAIMNWTVPRNEQEPVILGMDGKDDELPVSGFIRQSCACCACPTVNVELGRGTCLLCEWDNASNPAEQPLLADARSNVRVYLWTYSPAEPPPWRNAPPSPEEGSLKAQLVQIYARMKAEPEAADELWPEALSLERQLWTAGRRSIEAELDQGTPGKQAILDAASKRDRVWPGA